jgi:hypothetical protein
MSSKTLILSFLAFFLFGCGTTRVVSKAPGRGGIVALSTNYNASTREKADALMKENCGSKNVVIVEELEAEIGSTTKVTKSAPTPATTKKTSFLGIPVTHTEGGVQSEEHRTVKEMEWRIRYECQ